MTFIDKIELKNVRNIPPVVITLDPDVKKHLILTGPNGSGKTTVINELKKYIEDLSNRVGGYYDYALRDAKVANYSDIFKGAKANEYRADIKSRELSTRDESAAVVSFTNDDEFYQLHQSNDYLFCVFDAHRRASFIEPKGPTKIEIKNKEELGKYFIQLLVNLRTQSSFARDDNNMERVRKTELWFDSFKNALAELLGNEDFVLKFDYENFTFTIEEKEKEPYHFTELSDGYSALLYIVSELMIRMSLDPIDSYNKQGVVLIDEIENHLHVELQKKVLPFLIKFFPGIQFIVTTHSPFVLSSIKNSVIYDLEKREQYSDFSEYSYSGIVEDYFGENKYSNSVVNEISEIEKLLEKDVLSTGEIARIKTAYNAVCARNNCLELQMKLGSLITKNYSKLYGVL